MRPPRTKGLGTPAASLSCRPETSLPDPTAVHSEAQPRRPFPGEDSLTAPQDGQEREQAERQRGDSMDACLLRGSRKARAPQLVLAAALRGDRSRTVPGCPQGPWGSLLLTVTRATCRTAGAKPGPSALRAHTLSLLHTARPDTSHDVPAASYAHEPSSHFDSKFLTPPKLLSYTCVFVFDSCNFISITLAKTRNETHDLAIFTPKMESPSTSDRRECHTFRR